MSLFEKIDHCRKCRTEIIWAKTFGDKNHPFDAKKGLALVKGEVLSVNLSHFATCPNSAEFSGKTRKEVMEHHGGRD